MGDSGKAVDVAKSDAAAVTKAPTKAEWPTTGGLLRLKLPPWLFYVCAVWTVLTTAGVIYGWVSMSSVLEAEGVFADKCSPVEVINGTASGGAPCKEQQLALNSVYTTASIFAYVAPIFFGVFLDSHGPRATILLCLSIFTLGPAFAIAAAASGLDNLYYPAFIAMGAAASSMLTPLYSVSNLFLGWEGLLLAILNGSFDAASLVYRIMSAMYQGELLYITIFDGCPLCCSFGCVVVLSILSSRVYAYSLLSRFLPFFLPQAACPWCTCGLATWAGRWW